MLIYIHSFNTYLVNIPHIPGTIIETEHLAVNTKICNPRELKTYLDGNDQKQSKMVSMQDSAEC